jgi:hypothetical protein
MKWRTAEFHKMKAAGKRMKKIC